MPEPVGQRRVDVERLLGRPALLPLGHHGDGPHVVEPVGQLDDEDPPVVGHGHEHLAHRGGLLGLLGVELQPVELGDPVDDGRRPRGRTPRSTSLEGEPGVLDGVVQQRGGHRPGVEAEVGHDAGHRHRVGDVGLAGLAQLAGVGRLGGGSPARTISWRSSADDVSAGRRRRPSRPASRSSSSAGRRKGAA